MSSFTARCEEEVAVPEVVVEAPVEVAVEEPAPARTIVLQTAKSDPRFPATNQAKACYVWYNEMYKCYSQKGREDEACLKIKKNVRSICPDEWLANWEEHRENGTWWGKY